MHEINEGNLPQRRWDIDWLRIVAVVGLLVPYHTYRVFDIREDWYVKNDELSAVLNPFLYLGDTVGMQLLFLLAGSATWFALRRKNGRQYAWERIKRLLFPFIFAMLVIVPPQSFLGFRHHSGYAGSFFDWYPNFFTFHEEDLAGYSMGGFGIGHLWFVLFLLIISLIALPLILLFRQEWGKRIGGKLAAVFSIPGMILLLIIPVIAAERIIGIYPNPLYFFTFFIYGYFILTDPRIEEAIGRHKSIALILGLLALVLFTIWVELNLGERFNMPGWVEVAFRRSVMSWLLIVALLGYGKKYLNAPPRKRRSLLFMGYFGEGSYPFYILHQTVIVAIAFFIVEWSAGVAAKYLAIAAAAYLATIAMYDLLVRRTNPTRFLFGMRPRKGKHQDSAASKPELA